MTTSAPPAKKVEAKRRHEKVADTADVDEQPAKVVLEAESPSPRIHPDVSGVVPETQDSSPDSPESFPRLEIDLEVSDSMGE